MGARKRETNENKFVDRRKVQPAKYPVTIYDVALKAPQVVLALEKSHIQQNLPKPDWSKYRINIEDNVVYVIREYCARCDKVFLYPAQRKLRVYEDEDIGPIYLDEGICKDCINASLYVDKYLDGKPLTEAEAKKLFYKYGVEYEKAWRIVLAQAPRLAISIPEWDHACRFFNGCAMCGGPIEVQTKFFPRKFNGEHTAWNVIPMCEVCNKKHTMGRLDATKNSARYKIFSTDSSFQKTKTIRMFLLAQMERHKLYMEPLEPWRKRFFETKILNGAWLED